MLVGLGYNNALESGESPAFGTLAYWGIHGALLVSALAVILLLGFPLQHELFKSIRERRISVEGLFFISAMGAFCGSVISTATGQGSVYYEVVAIVLSIYAVGRAIGSRSRRNILQEVGKLRESFRYAWIIEDGVRIQTKADDLCPCSSQVSVMPGEPFTVNGMIKEGTGYISESSLTGEPAPVVKKPGDTILAGSYSVDGTFLLQPDIDSPRIIDSILDTVEKARQRPSRLQEQADRLMQWFLPLVLLVSGGTFLMWLLMPGVAWWEALFNSMAVLLVACPCALGLATPMAVWGGLNHLSKMGLVARSGRFIDELARADTILFDKTGTLSEEALCLTDFRVTDAWKAQSEQLRHIVGAIEEGLPHPVAKALAQPNGSIPVTGRKLIPGMGVEAVVQNKQFRIGELELMPESAREEFEQCTRDLASKKTLYVAAEGQPAAMVQLEEQLREGSEALFADLASLKIHFEILTGDTSSPWPEIGGARVITGLKPEDKLSRLKDLQSRGGQVVFVGDGLNDAGALAEAHTSIAMNTGAELSRSTADAIVMGNTLSVIPKAIRLARKVQRSIHGNIRFAVGYNGIGMSLAAMGLLHPVVAALLMAGSSTFVSWRALKATGSE